MCKYFIVKVLLYLRAGDPFSTASVEAASDDALFRDKLRHMGKCKSVLNLYRFQKISFDPFNLFSCISSPQLQEKNCLKLPDHFLRGQKEESQKGH